MTSRYGLIRKLRTFLSRRRTEADIADELEVHLELQAGKYRARGIPETEARRLARVEFGSIEKTREECWETDSSALLDAVTRNLRNATSSLGRQPGFTLIALAILAMGIGSTLAVFNLINAIMLRPLPVRNAGELIRVSKVLRDGEFGSLPSTFLNALKTVPDYSGVCGFDTGYPGVEIHGSITSVGTLGFSGDCFSTLGIQVQLGRTLTLQDDQPGSELVAVITDALWRREFNRSRDALGQRIRMEGKAYTVIGVAESRFSGLLIGFPEGLIIPISQEHTEMMPNGKRPTYWWVNILARRSPGISEQQALARIKARSRQLLELSIPPNYTAQRTRDYLASDIVASSGSAGIDYFLRRRFGSSLFAAGGICVAILFIGCTNLVNLLLARSLSRRHESAIRFALGAKWSQIVGLFVTESLVLVTAGAGLGVLLAQALDKWLLSVGSRMFGNFDLGLSFDWRVALLLGVATTVIALSFSGVSVWQAQRVHDSTTLKDGRRGMTRSSRKAQKILIGVQISLTLALVTGSSLLTASVDRLYNVDLGVKTRNVWDVELSARPAAKTYFSRGSYDREILTEVHRIPGVQTVALTDSIPFFSVFQPEPIATVDASGAQPEVDGSVLATSAEFFRTLGMSLVAGQEFEETESGEPTVILSESLAAQLAARPRDLIGHHIRLGTDSRYQRLKVTGVISNAQMDLAHPEQAAPYTAYVNIWQHADDQGYPVILIRSASNTLDLDMLRRIVDSRGHGYVYRVRTLVEEKDGALMENKLLASLSGALSGLALLMAAIGLFGLLSYQVANRTSEIGLRMALGAQRTHIAWMIMREMIAVVGIGSCAGIFLSFGVARIIQGLLFGVSPYDPRLFALSFGVLVASAVLAAWFPARRASSVDPLVALRYE
jgi:predicted permease